MSDDKSQETCPDVLQHLNAREKVFRQQWEFLAESVPSQPVAIARQKVTGFLILRSEIWSARAKSRFDRDGDGALESKGVSCSADPNRRRTAFPVALQILVLTLISLALWSCSHRPNQSAAPKATHEVTDEAGRRVVLPVKIDRIVSLAPNLTEIVYAVGAGDRLVGDTTYCDYPDAAKSVAKVGDTMHPSVERIIALKPQIVLVSTASQLEAFTKQLSDQQIVVYVTNPGSVDEILRSIETLGDLFGNHDQAAGVAGKLRERASRIEAALKSQDRIRVFYQVSGEPLYTIGRDSFLTDLVKRAGGISVTADVPSAFPRYSDEAALAAKPDAIILPTGGSMGSANSTVAPALKNSPAVLNSRVYKINDDHLSRPGPRLIDGLEEMARALHPDVFK